MWVLLKYTREYPLPSGSFSFGLWPPVIDLYFYASIFTSVYPSIFPSIRVFMVKKLKTNTPFLKWRLEGGEKFHDLPLIRVMEEL